MAVPYTFGSATASIPLSQLDSNFATTITLGNTAVQLGNTITTLTGVTNLASSGALTLGSNGNTTAVYVDTSQNVGVQITPVTTSLGPSIQLGNQMTLTSFNGNSCYFDNNIYYNGSFKYTGNGYGASLRFTDANFVFSNAPNNSSGAGASATLTERMRMDSSGNVGINQTSPTVISTAKQLAIKAPTNGDALFVSQNSNGLTTFIAGYYGVTAGPDKPVVGSYSNDPVAFITNNTERMRIDSSGNLLVGSTSLVNASIANITQSSAGNGGLGVLASNASYTATVILGSTSRAANSSFDFLGMYASGTSSAQFRVSGTGVIYAQNTSVQSISDQRLKENIRDSSDGLSVINALRPVRYDWKEGYGNDKKNQLGFIAQEIESVFPEAVGEWQINKDDETTYKTVGPSSLIPVLVKAIQELKAINDTQAETINALTARIVALESK